MYMYIFFKVYNLCLEKTCITKVPPPLNSCKKCAMRSVYYVLIFFPLSTSFFWVENMAHTKHWVLERCTCLHISHFQTCTYICPNFCLTSRGHPIYHEAIFILVVSKGRYEWAVRNIEEKTYFLGKIHYYFIFYSLALVLALHTYDCHLIKQSQKSYALKNLHLLRLRNNNINHKNLKWNYYLWIMYFWCQ